MLTQRQSGACSILDRHAIRAIRSILLAAGAFLLGSPALAAKLITYGNRAGEEAHFVSSSGVSTAHAVLKAEIKRADAENDCHEQEDKVTPKCVADARRFRLRPLTANCPASTFTDFSGDHWHFEGRQAKPEPLETKLRFFNETARDEADGSMASDYGLAFTVFRTLCPRQAPPQSEGY